MTTNRRTALIPVEQSSSKLALPWIHHLQNGASKSILQFIQKQRWFRSKEKSIQKMEISDYAIFEVQDDFYYLLFFQFHFQDQTSETYFVPLISLQDSQQGAKNEVLGETVATLETDFGRFLFFNAFLSPEFKQWFVLQVNQGENLKTEKGNLTFRRSESLFDADSLLPEDIRNLKVEQSNTSLVIQDESIFKVYRKMEAGINPEVELLGFLNAQEFASVPKLKADVVYTQAGEYSASLGMIQGLVKDAQDGWACTLLQLNDYYERFLKNPFSSEDDFRKHLGSYLSWANQTFEQLGKVTGQMHRALALDTGDIDFSPEPVCAEDVDQWIGHYQELVQSVFQILRRKVKEDSAHPLRKDFESLIQTEQIISDKADLMKGLLNFEVKKMRYHGDYHLGQVLKQNEDWVLIDFEGEPLRSLEERKAKACPLKDVAGMLRSFNYAAYVSCVSWQGKAKGNLEKLAALAQAWESTVRDAFLKGYFTETFPKVIPFLFSSFDVNQYLLSVFELDKAIYELNYELNNRPDWVFVPLAGIQRLLDKV